MSWLFSITFNSSHCRPKHCSGRQCFDSISVPSVKYDLTDRLRVPIADLFQFLRTQLTAQATPVLIQLGKVQKPHWNFRQPEPFRLLDQNKSAGSIPLCKGRIWIMDVLQKKDRLVVSAEFGRIEVPYGCVRIHFCHSSAVFPGQCMAHPAERFFIQEQRRICVYAPKSCDSSGKYHFIIFCLHFLLK